MHELRYEGKETRAAVLREQTAVFVLSSTERASQLLSKHTNIRRLREESQRGTGLEGSLSFGVKEMAKVPGADDENGAEGGEREGEDVGANARARLEGVERSEKSLRRRHNSLSVFI